MQRPALILTITGGLIVAGSLFGALAGAIALGVSLTTTEGPRILGDNDLPVMLAFGAFYGSIFGGIGAPIAGWVLMRRVPLGRAFAGSIMGAVIGGIAGWNLNVAGDEVTGGIICAVIGYVLAVIALRVWGQSRSAMEA